MAEINARGWLAGSGLYVALMVIGGIGAGALIALPAAAAVVTMRVVGALTTFFCVGLFYAKETGKYHGIGLKVKRFDAIMWLSVIQVAVLSTIGWLASISASKRIGIGPVAVVAACAFLCVGLKKILKSLGEERREKTRPGPVRAWGRKQLRQRMIALAGVIVIVQPWEGRETLDFIGLGLAAISAVCAWNFVVVMYGPVKDRDMKTGQAMVTVVAMPAAGVAAFVLPDGWTEMSWHVVLVAGLVGLISPITVFGQDWVAKKVETYVIGVLSTLNPAIMAVVGTLGAALGLLSDVQRPDSLWVWAGIALAVAASLRVALLGPKPLIGGRSGPN